MSLLRKLLMANANIICGYDILYKSYYYDVVNFYRSAEFLDENGQQAKLLSNTYDKDKNYGRLVFDRPISSISRLFYYSSGLLSITLPDSLITIGYEAFSGCNYLEEIIIPNSVVNIETDAFAYCNSLTNIVIGDGVQNLKFSAFEHEVLKYMTISENNKTYEMRSNCIVDKQTNTLVQGFTDGVVPNGITAIGEGAFYYCDSFTEANITNNITSIGRIAFYHCDSLKNIIIPDSVENVGDHAFSYCGNLTGVTIGESVEALESGCFEYCTSLTDIVIPNSVKSIKDDAFGYCTSLTNVTLPNLIKTVYGYSFRGCEALENITIPEKVTLIQGYAFIGCKNLAKIAILASVPPKIYDYSFKGISDDFVIYVPSDSVETYKAAIIWKDYADKIQAIS